MEKFGRNDNKYFIEEFGNDTFLEVSNFVNGVKSNRVNFLHKSKLDLESFGLLLLDETIVIEWRNGEYIGFEILSYGEDMILPSYIDKKWIRQISINKLLKN